MRFSTNIQNNNEFFTDLNGFQVTSYKAIPNARFQFQAYPEISIVVIDATSQNLNKASLASQFLSDA